MIDKSTICAISTPSGTGAIAIIRLSGEDAISVCEKVFRSPNQQKKISEQPANTVHFGILTDEGTIIDEVLVSLFRAPHSYTGEDSVEVSIHGSQYIQQKVLQLFIKNGARLAEPGEFTLRAFLNGKMDLSQAEAVADLIASTSEASRKIAMHQMRGGFSNEIRNLRKKLLDFITLVELELDFSEEDVEFADRKQLKELISMIIEVLTSLTKSFELGNVIKHGIPVAIVGEPNVGKSTLLNVLLNEEKAIVSEIAGTTRDAIEDVIAIQGVSFRFIDTAGLRHTTDTIESLGIERTHSKIKQASIVLLLVNAESDVDSINQSVKKTKALFNDKKKFVLVVNKMDKIIIKEASTKYHKTHFISLTDEDSVVTISAKKHLSIEELINTLVETVNFSTLNKDDVIITNARHFEALVQALESLERARTAMDNNLSGDLFSQDVREALHYLGEITGEITTDEVLGNIFKNFCIGK